MMTRRKTKSHCYQFAQHKYPGYYLLMDRMGRDYYASLWGKKEERVEIILSRRQSGDIKAHVANYKIF